MTLDLVIAGVQKAGTSALARQLNAHPGIVMSRQKELHIFDDERRMDWASPDYRRIDHAFRDARSGQLRGEATPAYLYWPNALTRMKAYNPEMRLIVMLRDPVERAFSAWRMERSCETEPLDFARAVREGRRRIETDEIKPRRRYSYVERGFYDVQIAQLFDRFPRKQCLILKYEDYRADYRTCLDAIARFLGIGPYPEHPPNDTVLPRRFERLGVDYLARKKEFALDPADADYLRGLYRPSIERTAELTGLDLGDWLESEPAGR